MERELDLVPINDERRQELLGRVRQLDTMLQHREWWAPAATGKAEVLQSASPERVSA
jgi:hypothetical protein